MFSWLSRPRARIEHIDAEAEALIAYFGAEAYSEARRRECEASSDAIAEDWDRVALMVARKTEGRAESLADSDFLVNPPLLGKPSCLIELVPGEPNYRDSAPGDRQGVGGASPLQ
jgi:hypothetical protein